MVDIILPEDGRHIRVGPLGQLDQPMLDLDIIMCTRKSESRGGFKRAPAMIVQPVDQ